MAWCARDAAPSLAGRSRGLPLRRRGRRGSASAREPRPRRRDHLRRARRAGARARDPARGLRRLRTAATRSSISCTACPGSSVVPGQRLARSTRSRRAGPAILVIPQGARDGDTDPEYLDWGRGRNWSTYVSTELPHYIDAHFRTIRAPVGTRDRRRLCRRLRRDVVGLNNLGRFSVIESWSGYFHPTDPTGTRALSHGRLAIAHRLIGDAEERRAPPADLRRVLRRHAATRASGPRTSSSTAS